MATRQNRHGENPSRRPPGPEERGFHKRSEELRAAIKEAVSAVEPGAEVILYGSRARGDARPDSDWDLLILVDGPVTGEREDRLRHRLYEVEWARDEILSSIVCSRKDWASPVYGAMPFHENVDREGVVL